MSSRGVHLLWAAGAAIAVTIMVALASMSSAAAADVDPHPDDSCVRTSDASGVRLEFIRGEGDGFWHIRRSGRWLASLPSTGDAFLDMAGTDDDAYIVRYWLDEDRSVTVPCIPEGASCEAWPVDGGVRISWDWIPGDDTYGVRKNGEWLTERLGFTLVDEGGTVDDTYVVRAHLSGVVVQLDCELDEGTACFQLILADCEVMHAFRELTDGRRRDWRPELDPCSWSGVQCGAVDGDVRVVGLQVNSAGLTELPVNFGELTGLLRVNLEHNDLITLPDSFTNLTNLEQLWLVGNELVELPDSFGSLHSLRLVAIRVNNLSKLPESIGQLDNLGTLDVRRNQIERLPSSIGDLKSLQRLYLSNNELPELPDSIGSLASLDVLLVNRNNLTELPETIGSLSSLTDLEVGSNALTSLPDSVGDLSALEWLAVDHNELSGDISGWVRGLTDQTVTLELGPRADTCFTANTPGMRAWLRQNAGANWARCA